MPKNDYMPTDDRSKADLFLHVAATMSTFYNRLGLVPSTPQLLIQAADATAFDYMLRAQQVVLAAAKEATATKNRLRDGDPARPGLAANVAFPSSPGAIPTAVTPGVVARFRVFVDFLRGLAGFGPDVAAALRITGAQQSGPDMATLKPVLPLLLQGGHVFIDWGWGGYGTDLDAVEIQVDRGGGTFAMLTIDTRPGYLDTEPMPATPGRWKYKAIFRQDDARVGLWSDVAEVAVG